MKICIRWDLKCLKGHWTGPKPSRDSTRGTLALIFYCNFHFLSWTGFKAGQQVGWNQTFHFSWFSCPEARREKRSFSSQCLFLTRSPHLFNLHTRSHACFDAPMQTHSLTHPHNGAHPSHQKCAHTHLRATHLHTRFDSHAYTQSLTQADAHTQPHNHLRTPTHSLTHTHTHPHNHVHT